MEKLKFSVVENFKITKTSLEDAILAGLGGEKMRSKIEPLRQMLAEGKKDEADILKRALPAIIPSGVFRSRTADGILEYNKIVCLDLDKIEIGKMAPLKKLIEECEYTYLVFISPSGNGLKIWIKVDSKAFNHRDAYKQVLEFYQNLTGQKFDEKTSDINRLMFLSYDPTYYYYPDSKIFNVNIPEPPRMVNQPLSITMKNRNQYDEMYQKAYNIIKSKEKYEEGNRNNFIHKLASHCNRYGVPLDELKYKLGWCKLPDDEISTCLKSAYSHKDQFATWNWQGSSEPDPKAIINKETEVNTMKCVDEDCQVAEYLETKIENIPAIIIGSKTTPTFPPEVYEALPKILKDISNEVDDNRQRDMLLLSNLTVISSLLPNVYGMYDKEIGTNLFFFILGPAGSGKGIANRSRDLGERIQVEVMKNKKSLFIPADNSVSMIKEMMYKNKNYGIIHETEADTLAHALKNDWGNFSDTLRKVFHHEAISLARRTNGEHIEIQRSFLSVLLTGTHNQLLNTIKNLEDGFMSRFLYYDYDCDPVWKNQRLKKDNRLSQVIETASIQVEKMWNLQKDMGRIFVDLQPHQEIELNAFFESKLDRYKQLYGNAVAACINRHSLMCYRIAIILSILREMDTTGILPEKLMINDIDFKNALSIIEISLVHLGKVFERFGASKTEKLNYNQRLVYEAIPDDCSRSEYDTIAASLGVLYKTAEKYLNDFKRHGLIKSMGHGNYKKVA